MIDGTKPNASGFHLVLGIHVIYKRHLLITDSMNSTSSFNSIDCPSMRESKSLERTPNTTRAKSVEDSTPSLELVVTSPIGKYEAGVRTSGTLRSTIVGQVYVGKTEVRRPTRLEYPFVTLSGRGVPGLFMQITSHRRMFYYFEEDGAVTRWPGYVIVYDHAKTTGPQYEVYLL